MTPCSLFPCLLVNLLDLQSLVACLTGPNPQERLGIGSGVNVSRKFDYDGDGDLDLLDFAACQNRFTA